jgi:hypothetical protein
VRVLLDGNVAEHTLGGRERAEGLTRQESIQISIPCGAPGKHAVQVTWRATFTDPKSGAASPWRYSIEQSIQNNAVYVVDRDALMTSDSPAPLKESGSGLPATKAVTSSTQP